MIDTYNEFEIVQNNLLGVHALHEFVSAFVRHNKGIGPKLYQSFPVLPLVYNSEATGLICQRKFSIGSFVKIVNERADIFISLQERMERMSSKTFNCLRLANNAGLFGYDMDTTRLFLIQGRPIMNHKELDHDYQKILFAAKRLGFWFSKLDEYELLFYLNIKF